MSLLKYLLKESIQIKEDQEGLWEIHIKNNENKVVGKAWLESFYEYNWDIEDVMDEDEFYRLIPSGEYISLRSLDVDVDHRGMGYAKKLMKYVIEFSKKDGWEHIHLNASSKDNFKGLSQWQLVDFYKKFGFKEIKNQGNNSIMILDL